MSKFCLVYEPMYSKSQFIIDFKLNENSEYSYKHIELFNRYIDIPSQRNGKKDLLTIDKLTNSFDSEADFLHEVRIFRPLHSFFVAYPVKGYVNRLRPVFNNQELNNAFSTISYNKVLDPNLVEEMSSLLVSNDEFKMFYKKGNYYKSYELNKRLELVGHYERMLEIEPDLETSYAYYETIGQLKEEIKKYHVFREMLLAKQDFEKLPKKAQSKTFEISRKPEEKNLVNELVLIEAEEQLTLDGFPKTLIKR